MAIVNVRSADMTSLMRNETLEIPARVTNLLNEKQAEKQHVLRTLKNTRPPLVISFARGSSDHAATLAHHLLKARYGVWSFSCPPSQFQLGAKKLDLSRAIAFAVSQSGQSTDILNCIDMASQRGASTLAFVNAPIAPLRDRALCTWNIDAGLEQSVAATKSFVCSVVALLDFASKWQKDEPLQRGLDGLPDQLATALSLDWTAAITPLVPAHALLLISRGEMMGGLDEAALKLKETCGLHATAYSAAELKHGPLALIGRKTPAWVVAPPGPHQSELIQLASELRAMGGHVTLFTDTYESKDHVDFNVTSEVYLDVLTWVTPFYVFAEKLAVARGLNPDTPPHLRKITITT